MTPAPRSIRPLHLRAAGLLLIVVALGACASGGGNLRQARVAEQQQDYDLAVAEYTKAARARPDDRTIRLSTAPSCAPRKTTSPAPAATPPPTRPKKRWSSTSSPRS
jgi:hypothetical protein